MQTICISLQTDNSVKALSSSNSMYFSGGINTYGALVKTLGVFTAQRRAENV